MKHFLFTLLFAALSFYSYSQRTVQVVYDNGRAYLHFVGDASQCAIKQGEVNGQDFNLRCLNFLPIEIPKSGIIDGEVHYSDCTVNGCLWEGEQVKAGYKRFTFFVPKRIMRIAHPSISE